MKTKFTLLVLFFTVTLGFSQTDGISYQAVIIDNNPQEIPGVDIPSNNLPNVPLTVRFSIIDSVNSIEYQETQNTTTDPYGMINLMIGHGNASMGAFNEIYWDNSKYLKVEIDLHNGDGMVEFSFQELTYIPYVRHREIIATSTLDVDGATNLNNTLTVDNTTNLNSALTVNNAAPTHLTGDLTVDGLVSFDGDLEVGGDTQLYADLTVDGITNLNNSLFVNNGAPTLLSGDLNVLGQSNFQDGYFENITVAQNSHLNVLGVDGESQFNDQVTISAFETGGQDDYDAFPLRVEGSQQGIAIKVTPNNPNRNNNYLTFFDGDNTIRGRVEANNGLVTIGTNAIYDLIGIPDFGDIIGSDPGDTPPDVAPNQYFNNDYAFGAYSLTVELVNSIIRFGINATAASGACVTGDCDDAIWSFVDFIVAGIQLGGYITYNEINIGVAFESGGADYAEWLLKANPQEQMSFGDVVGVQGGKISKKYTKASNFMVISQNPMVSGALPNEAEKRNYDKVAFLGQVPVKVVGACNIGDYILPSNSGDGFAIAVAPSKMKIDDYQRIVGVAWSESQEGTVFNYVQTAIGINANDMTLQVQHMQRIMNSMQKALAKLDAEFEPVYFDVDGSIQTQDTQVTTIKGQIADASSAFDYSTLKEALGSISSLETIQSKETKTGFDIYKLPYIKEMIANPTKENAEKMVDYYMSVLGKLNAMKIAAEKQ